MIKINTITSTIAFTLFFGLTNCATKVSTPPCYDGWSSNENGSSLVWSPNAVERKAIEIHIPMGHETRCFHRMPDSKVTAITESQKTLYYFELEPDGGKFKLIDDGIISSHN